MAECNINENKVICNCSYPCEKKGMCCQCLRYHLSRGEVPACFFPDDVEKTYNRTVENYYKTYKERN